MYTKKTVGECTAIYGEDHRSRGEAYDPKVAQLWASAPDLVAALQYIADLCRTSDVVFRHTLRTKIASTCDAALERAQPTNVHSELRRKKN